MLRTLGPGNFPINQPIRFMAGKSREFGLYWGSGLELRAVVSSPVVSCANNGIKPSK